MFISLWLQIWLGFRHQGLVISSTKTCFCLFTSCSVGHIHWPRDMAVFSCVKGPVVHKWFATVPKMIPKTCHTGQNLYSNSLWTSAQQSTLEIPSFEQLLIKKLMVVVSCCALVRKVLHCWSIFVCAELLGCTQRWWKEISIPCEDDPQCQKACEVCGVQGRACVCKTTYGSPGSFPRVGEAWLWLSALRRAYGSLRLWMKSINHPHSRDRNREVFPVPPTLKYFGLSAAEKHPFRRAEWNNFLRINPVNFFLVNSSSQLI